MDNALRIEILTPTDGIIVRATRAYKLVAMGIAVGNPDSPETLKAALRDLREILRAL